MTRTEPVDGVRTSLDLDNLYFQMFLNPYLRESRKTFTAISQITTVRLGRFSPSVHLQINELSILALFLLHKLCMRTAFRN